MDLINQKSNHETIIPTTQKFGMKQDYKGEITNAQFLQNYL